MNDFRPLIADADDDYLAPEVERDVLLSDGTVEGLHPAVALMRHTAHQSQAERRAAYCVKHGKDPAVFRGCVDCGGTGKAWDNDLPCHCPAGANLLRFIGKHERATTEGLIENLKDPDWLGREPIRYGPDRG